MNNFGAEGVEWLESLPARIAALERAWHFQTGAALNHGGCVSWVAPVTQEDGTEAILKIGIPHDESRFEAEALCFHNGRGFVQLLNVSEDGFSLLLERCRPGSDLWSLDALAGDDVAISLLPQIWKDPLPDAPFIRLAELMEEWCDDIPNIVASGGCDRALVERVLERGRELVASQERHVYLHGDFHPGNVLAAERAPWLVIDPKSAIGEPAYDLAQWLHNRYHAAAQTSDPIGILKQQIHHFATTLKLDPKRIADWTVVKGVGWESPPEMVGVFERIAESL